MCKGIIANGHQNTENQMAVDSSPDRGYNTFIFIPANIAGRNPDIHDRWIRLLSECSYSG
ncbi:hypothetical protein V8V91_00005 [Algoriphagus halophilus]|uniref:hypothetical protein n=1 Tax=Algoriphagus halophilus TaxID=226505 RepID=UPI003A645AE7